MSPAALILAGILAAWPAGPSSTASVLAPLNDGSGLTVGCDLARGAELDRGTWSEVWGCYAFKTGCQSDQECIDSEFPIGTIERGAVAGRQYSAIHIQTEE